MCDNNNILFFIENENVPALQAELRNPRKRLDSKFLWYVYSLVLEHQNPDYFLNVFRDIEYQLPPDEVYKKLFDLKNEAMIKAFMLLEEAKGRSGCFNADQEATLLGFVSNDFMEFYQRNQQIRLHCANVISLINENIKRDDRYDILEREILYRPLLLEEQQALVSNNELMLLDLHFGIRGLEPATLAYYFHKKVYERDRASRLK